MEPYQQELVEGNTEGICHSAEPVETERQLSDTYVLEKATVHPFWKQEIRSVRQVGSLSTVGVDS